MVTTLGRFAGRTVGVIANNPLRLGGCLDASSAEKAAAASIFAVTTAPRRGVASRVAVMVWWRYSLVMLTMPSTSTNAADDAAAP